MRIVLVDDNQAVRETFAARVAAAGHEVVGQAGGKPPWRRFDSLDDSDFRLDNGQREVVCGACPLADRLRGAVRTRPRLAGADRALAATGCSRGATARAQRARRWPSHARAL